MAIKCDRMHGLMRRYADMQTVPRTRQRSNVKRNYPLSSTKIQRNYFEPTTISKITFQCYFNILIQGYNLT